VRNIDSTTSAQAHSVLLTNPTGSIRITRLSEATADARTILQEYYEALQVVQRDTPEAIQTIIDDHASGFWLAYRAAEVVGCVVLRRLTSIPGTSECKRLYVKPSARGQHVAEQLLDALEAYARQHDVQWVYLDSHDGLTAAIALYRKRGYQPCERYNSNPQATLFMCKKI